MMEEIKSRKQIYIDKVIKSKLNKAFRNADPKIDKLVKSARVQVTRDDFHHLSSFESTRIIKLVCAGYVLRSRNPISYLRMEK
jgi:hypothetical protein